MSSYVVTEDAVCADSHGDWATCRAGPSPNVVDGDKINPGAALTATYQINRGFLLFDLSGLPSNYVVNNARLSLSVRAKGSAFDAAEAVCITEGSQGIPLVASDSQSHASSATKHGTTTSDTFVAGTRADITFTTAGLAIIEAACGGNLKLCLRIERDIDSVPPIYSTVRYIWFHSNEISGEEPTLYLNEWWDYPNDSLARVSSIRHICHPGFYRMQVGLGDLGFDIDVAEATVRKALDTAKETEEAPPEPPPTKPSAKPPEAAPTPPAPEPPTPPSYWGAGPVSQIPGIEEYRERRRREEAAAPEQPSLWSRITPWKEEAGETFGGEVMERIESMRKWIGGLFK